MIQSINLSNSYTVPFGPGSALIKCRLITLTQMGVRGTYSRAVPPFASIFEELFWYLKHEMEVRQVQQKISPCPFLAGSLFSQPACFVCSAWGLKYKEENICNCLRLLRDPSQEISPKRVWDGNYHLGCGGIGSQGKYSYSEDELGILAFQIPFEAGKIQRDCIKERNIQYLNL